MCIRDRNSEESPSQEKIVSIGSRLVDLSEDSEKRAYQECSFGQENLFDELIPMRECSEQDRSY